MPPPPPPPNLTDLPVWALLPASEIGIRKISFVRSIHKQEGGLRGESVTVVLTPSHKLSVSNVTLGLFEQVAGALLKCTNRVVPSLNARKTHYTGVFNNLNLEYTYTIAVTKVGYSELETLELQDVPGVKIYFR